MIVVDQNRATLVAKQKIRFWRDAEFAKNDVALQNAMADDNQAAKQKAVERRDYLRALPEQCEGKTVEQLQQLLAELGIA